MTARTQEHAPSYTSAQMEQVRSEFQSVVAQRSDLLAERDDLLAVLEQVRDFWAGGDAPEALENVIHAAIARARGSK